VEHRKKKSGGKAPHSKKAKPALTVKPVSLQPINGSWERGSDEETRDRAHYSRSTIDSEVEICAGGKINIFAKNG
ncbi:MAG TPA: hypothetical protein VMG10_10580, partial [Gemmataceae bacterium]|nr:hypothetical protein [Gemmataceae bacterium]